MYAQLQFDHSSSAAEKLATVPEIVPNVIIFAKNVRVKGHNAPSYHVRSNEMSLVPEFFVMHLFNRTR